MDDRRYQSGRGGHASDDATSAVGQETEAREGAFGRRKGEPTAPTFR